MARDEIRLADQVGRANRFRPEAYMRDGDSSGLLRVVYEVALGVVVRSLPDNFDGVLVRSHRSVGSQPVEQCANRARVLGRKLRIVSEARMRDIVDDANREMILGLRLFDFV